MAVKSKGFTKSQIATLARQIALYLPKAAAASAAGAMSFRRRSKAKAAKYVNPIVVDTSVFIDGRIVEIAKTGFLGGELLIIPSVISELHTLSDSSNDLKRARGRRGLDVLESLKKDKKIKLIILAVEPDIKSTDYKLVACARKIRARLMTLDFNLNKVANVRGVEVLNLNELANAVKTAVLPHEVLTIQVKSRGKGRGQGVGYLDDGTMVVVEDGAEFLGKTVKLNVQRVIQTNAGKMIFGKASH